MLLCEKLVDGYFQLVYVKLFYKRYIIYIIQKNIFKSKVKIILEGIFFIIGIFLIIKNNYEICFDYVMINCKYKFYGKKKIKVERVFSLN